MMLRKSTLWLAVLLMAAMAPFSSFGQPNSYPAKPVRIVVPYATGGGSDILARQIGAGLQLIWGKGVVVENKTGAAGNIGSTEVARSSGDGYTLLLQNSSMVTNIGISGKLPYDPYKDLTPIMILGVTPMALVAHPSTGITSLKELVAQSKAKPNTLNYASCGMGTLQHFVMELIKQQTGADAGHAAYKGCSPAMTDVVSGQIPVAMLSANLVVPYAASGRVKVLGVTSGQRYSLLPDAPTFIEQGLKSFDYSIWYALMGPANMPKPVVEKIIRDVKQVLANPSVKTNLSTAGVEIRQGTAADLTKLVRYEADRYTELAKKANIKAE
jgi:tripartite-type tricarboxylate transporter receptor subunit TctC